MMMEQQDKIERLEKRLHMVERQAEAAEQYSRQDCLILRGKLNIKPNCSLREEVSHLIGYHTGVRFPSWCINTVHWLGGGKSIIIRFNNKTVRDEIYRNRIPKDINKRGLFIHELLTTAKMSLVSRCAGLRREGKLSTYFTMGGNVMVKRAKEAPSILVSPDMTNEDIMVKLDKQPRSYKEAAQPQNMITVTEEKEAPQEGEKRVTKEKEENTRVNKETDGQKTQDQENELQTTKSMKSTVATADKTSKGQSQSMDGDQPDPESGTDSEDEQKKGEKHGDNRQGGKGERKTSVDGRKRTIEKCEDGDLAGKGETASNSGSESDDSANDAKAKINEHKPDKSPTPSPTKRVSKRRREKKKVK